MATYTKKEYCEKYGLSESTLRRKVIGGNLPSSHSVKNLDGRGMVIIVDHCKLCADIESACIAYHKKAGNIKRPDVGAEISIKYNINTAHLFRILGL